MGELDDVISCQQVLFFRGIIHCVNKSGNSSRMILFQGEKSSDTESAVKNGSANYQVPNTHTHTIQIQTHAHSYSFSHDRYFLSSLSFGPHFSLVFTASCLTIIAEGSRGSQKPQFKSGPVAAELHLSGYSATGCSWRLVHGQGGLLKPSPSCQSSVERRGLNQSTVS